MGLRRSDKYVALLNLNICYTWEIMKMTKNKFKISAPANKDKLELPDRSFYLSDMSNYNKNVCKQNEKQNY